MWKNKSYKAKLDSNFDVNLYAHIKLVVSSSYKA